MNRQNRNKVAVVMIAAALLLSACGKGNDSAAGNVSAASGKPAQTSQDPKAKFEPPIDFTIAGTTEPNLAFDKGESFTNNTVYDAYVKDLGISIKPEWMVDPKQYPEKVRLSIVSGEIPDLMKVTAADLQQLVDNNLLADLTDVYDKYATPETKKFMSTDGGNQLASAKFDGKLMAIPSTNAPYNAAEFLWVRKDWMKKLNLPEPKTMQDVLKISEAFTNQDPDGNGKKDSFGFAAQKEIFNMVYGFTGIFNGYHAYPGAWIKDSSGKLVYGSVQPEIKNALKTLQDMYKAGQIDPEFFVKDHTKETELVAGNKIGMAFGPFFLGSWPLSAAVVKNNTVTQDWETYPLASFDDKPASTQVGLGVDGYYVVSKKSKHPEAAIKILNKWIEVDNTTDKQVGKPYHFSKTNQEYWKLNPIIVVPQDLNVKTGAVLSKAVETKDPTLVKDDLAGSSLYDDSMKFLKGDTGSWSSWMKAKPHGTLEIMNQYLKENRYMFDEFSGAPTATMAMKKPILDQKEQELFTKIITNKAPVDDFDAFVKDWNSLGGEQITKEVNDWYAKK
ncbi:MAG: sugar transporter substrate-binding protein [Cohnella sp.]|nr:sugar transporter substrate-binding protein [Cohnella sp.]